MERNVKQKKSGSVLAVLMALFVMALAGCGTAKDNVPAKEIESEHSAGYTIYYGNEMADGFLTETIALDALSPEQLIAALAEKGVFPKEGKVLSFTDDGETLTLDLSKEYEAFVAGYGTAGEAIAIGALVNTFLDAYQADSITLLVDGGAWSTGHADYDSPFGRFQMP